VLGLGALSALSYLQSWDRQLGSRGQRREDCFVSAIILTTLTTHTHVMRVHALVLNSAEMNHSLQNEQGPAVLRAANFANFAVLLAADGAAQPVLA
jgi:hypothetical protein